MTDQDTGPSADPVGNGRGTSGRPPPSGGKVPGVGASDQDSVISDPPGSRTGGGAPMQPGLPQRPSKRWR
ncbi:hypothetical protein [Pararhodobacter sp.]|uniref:hypothetical protein n=1 Tax=Pararhodobacter sp. TaxID=2127056 RepID=UPI002FE2C544